MSIDYLNTDDRPVDGNSDWGTNKQNANVTIPTTNKVNEIIDQVNADNSAKLDKGAGYDDAEYPNALDITRRTGTKYTFDTIADAQSSTWLEEGDIVEVLGYYDKGDGAGHTRHYSSVDDGSGIICGSGYLNLIFNPTNLNPLHAGCLCDGTDDLSNLQNFVNWVSSKVEGTSTVFNSGNSRGFFAIDLCGKEYSISDTLYLFGEDVGDVGGVGGLFGLKNGTLKALSGFVGTEVVKMTSINTFNWTQQSFLDKVNIDANRNCEYGIRAEKCVGLDFFGCHVTKYTDRGIYADNSSYNCSVSKCYIESYPFSEVDRSNTPNYGVYFGNSDNVIQSDTVIIGNIYGAYLGNRTRVIGNHFYGNKYSMKIDNRSCMVIGNYIEDPVKSIGLADLSFLGNFSSDSNRGGSIIVEDDGSGNGRGTSIIGNTSTSHSWSTTGDITLSALTGTEVTLTSTEEDFFEWVVSGQTSEGAIVNAGTGKAIITADIDTHTVTVQILNDFDSLTYTDGNWDIIRNYLSVYGNSPTLASSLYYIGSGGDISQVDNLYTKYRYNVTDVVKFSQQLTDEEISSGEITVRSSNVRVDTEGAVASDVLSTINGGYDGMRLTLSNLSINREITLEGGTGNLSLRGDCQLKVGKNFIELIYLTDAWYEINRSEKLGAGRQISTISSGVLSVSNNYVRVGTEGGTTTDTVDTINGGSHGDVIYLRTSSNSYTVTYSDGIGNLSLAGSFVAVGTNYVLQLIYDSSDGLWHEVSRSDNTV